MSRRRRLGVSLALALALAALALGLRPPAASAHAFLVSTDPAQGQRLERPPAEILLRFSEPAGLEAARVALRRHQGAAVATGELRQSRGGRQLRLPAAGLADGVYVVSWQALSAVDGHGSSGEFAFAIGDAAVAVPPARQEASQGWGATATTWAFVLGFSLAAGALAVRLAPGAPGRLAGRVIRAGLGLALAGALAALLISSGTRSTGSLIAASGALMAAALALERLARHPVPALVATLGAGAAWSGRSHAAGANGLLGAAVDFLHLAAGGLWAGALLAVVAVLWGARGDPLRARPELLRAYARLAPYLVLALVAAGTASAFLILPGWSELWTTGYGRLILAKSALLAAALCLALVARRRGIAGGRPVALRRAAGAEAVAVVAVLALAGVLANAAPPAPATAAEEVLGPPPITGPAVRDAGLAGRLTVYVTAGDGRLDLSLLSPSGAIEGAEIDVDVRLPDGGSADLYPRLCGAGCFTQRFSPPPGRTRLAITAAAPGWTGGTFRASLRWPPGPRAPERLERLIATMRAVPRLRLTETVSSGPGARADAFVTELSGAELIAAEPYAGGNVREVRSIPDEPDAFRFYLPGSRILGVMRVDRQGRLASADIVSPGHEITRRFSYSASRE